MKKQFSKNIFRSRGTSIFYIQNVLIVKNIYTTDTRYRQKCILKFCNCSFFTFDISFLRRALHVV